jgi:hypothetical protein
MRLHLTLRCAISAAAALSCLFLSAPVTAQVQLSAQQNPVADTAPPVTGDEIEIDFLTSYYSQDGEHSAVTGGIGTEEQTVISPVVVVRWKLSDLWTINGHLGVDNISSASVDNMDEPWPSGGGGGAVETASAAPPVRISARTAPSPERERSARTTSPSAADSRASTTTSPSPRASAGPATSPGRTPPWPRASGITPTPSTSTTSAV